MPEAGLEPTITASERAKTVHALERSATVTGGYTLVSLNIQVIVALRQVNPFVCII
jgi:hypothetical protein